MEQWATDDKNITNHRAMYSIVIAILQYLLPLMIVLVIYALIYKFLQEQQYPRYVWFQIKCNNF